MAAAVLMTNTCLSLYALCLNSPLSLRFSLAAIYYLPEVDGGRVLLSADETPSGMNFEDF